MTAEPEASRLRLLDSGFCPLPLIGKQPIEKGWQKRHDPTREEIKLWSRTAPAATNTGLLTRLAPCFDIDILDEAAAAAVEDLARDRFEERGYILTRFGKRPKRCVLFRTLEPFAKSVVSFDSGERLEMLADGQQFVCFGEHPETGQDYSWTGGEPGEIRHDDLPYISAEEAFTLVDDASGLLSARFGYRLASAKAKPNGADSEEAHGQDGGDWSFSADNLIDHDRLAGLAMRLLKTGMSAGSCVNLLRAQVEALVGVDEERRQRRLAEIPGMVSSAEAKLGQEANARSRASASGLVWFGDVPPAPPAYLIGETLPETGLAIVGGQFGAAKTFIVADLAAALRVGGDFAGRPVKRQGGTLWLAAEGANELDMRVYAAIAARGGDPDARQPFARQSGAVPCLGEREALDQLKALAAQASTRMRADFDCDLALIAFDTLSAAAGFDDENSAAETQKVMTMLAALAGETGTLVLAVDHYGKIVDTGVRGSSAKSAAADAILACLGDRDPNTGSMTNRRLAIAKLRGGPTGRVVNFSLDKTDDGATCVVSWRADADPGFSDKEAKPWPKSLYVFKRAFDEALDAAGKMTVPRSGMPQVKAVDSDVVRTEFYRLYVADSGEAKKKAFRRCAQDAIERGLLCSINTGPDLGQTIFWRP
jgi:AAA domain/Bifunctional DNA primase/polymerase, N-terminal